MTSPSAVTLETQLGQAEQASVSIALLAAGVAARNQYAPRRHLLLRGRCSQSSLRGDARLGPVLDKITQQSFSVAAEIANGPLLNFFPHLDH